MKITPKLARRRLAEALRSARETKMTGEEVANELGWQKSKVSRIETAGSGVGRYDLERLFDLYDIPAEQQEILCQLHRASQSRPWWNQSPYNSMLPASYRDFIGYEAEAVEEFDYQPLVFPGLLQIPDYARAIIASGPFVQDYERIDTLVEVRARRQALLAQDDPLELATVISLAPLLYEHGGRDVLRAQLVHVLEVTRLPNVALQIVPAHVSSGGYNGSLTVLHFESPQDPSVAFADAVLGSQERDNPREVRQYVRFFEHLRSTALNEADSRALIERRLEELT